MPYISPEIVQEVKRMDVLTYLKTFEPYELVHCSGNTYSTKTHDSLKISNGKWMWWSRGIGGRSALDYLIKVKGYSFLEAVETIAGQSAVCEPKYAEVKDKKQKVLLLPKKNVDNRKVISYLKNRGIDDEIIQFCIDTQRLYESENYHNAVFVGSDADGIPRYAAIRGTGSDFIGEANGSDKNYSFSIRTDCKCSILHLFESVIDLLSYATIAKYEGNDWRKEHLLSLAGVYQPAKEIEKSKVPCALANFLKEHPEVSEIHFHLDNDRAGRIAAKAIQMALPERYFVRDSPPKKGKDYNDFLCISLGIDVTKRAKRSKER